MDDMGGFEEGVDPENPDDIGVDPEKMDELIAKVESELRRSGLYAMNMAVTIVDDPDQLHKLGVRTMTDDPRPLILLAALSIGEKAWEPPEKDKISEEIIRMEMGLLDQTVEEIRAKYEKEKDDD